MRGLECRSEEQEYSPGIREPSEEVRGGVQLRLTLRSFRKVAVIGGWEISEGSADVQM